MVREGFRTVIAALLRVQCRETLVVMREKKESFVSWAFFCLFRLKNMEIDGEHVVFAFEWLLFDLSFPSLHQ